LRSTSTRSPSYVQKAKTALYEKGILFESKMIDGSEPVASEFAALWPIQRFPVIVDDGQFVFKATGIIEYLEARFPETARLIPSDLPLAAEVRMWDRFFAARRPARSGKTFRAVGMIATIAIFALAPYCSTRSIFRAYPPSSL
jgi:glutathione S-transferase